MNSTNTKAYFYKTFGWYPESIVFYCIPSFSKMASPRNSTSRPNFEYVNEQRPAVEIDLDAALKDVVNEHSAGLELDPEEHGHYQTQVPRSEPTTVEEEIHRAMLPDHRRKLLNLRYLTRLRGIVKFSQLVRVMKR